MIKTRKYDLCSTSLLSKQGYVQIDPPFRLHVQIMGDSLCIHLGLCILSHFMPQLCQIWFAITCIVTEVE